MKTLLRHTSTGNYFQSLDKWTPDRENAHDFGIVQRAIKFAKKIRVPNLELVLSVEEPQQLEGTSFGQFIRRAMRRARAARSGFKKRTTVRINRLRPAGAF